jgi:gliding motility-associated-like protein
MKHKLPNFFVQKLSLIKCEIRGFVVSFLQFGSISCSKTLVLLLFLLITDSAFSNNHQDLIVKELKFNLNPVKIQLSNNLFKADHNTRIAIGKFSTVDEDDTQHTYEFVQGYDEDKFEIVEDQLFLKSNKGLSGQYTFRIKVKSTDPSNNSINKEFELKKSTYKPDAPVKIPNAISPNNDGKNDTWIIPELRYYDIVQIEVFDRAGNRLFFTKDPEIGWDGKNVNGQVVQGSYFYMVRIGEHVQRGVITVYKKQ